MSAMTFDSVFLSYLCNIIESLYFRFYVVRRSVAKILVTQILTLLTLNSEICFHGFLRVFFWFFFILSFCTLQ